MYISLEGIDTSGKSTQINALKDIYPNAFFTSEPSIDTFGSKIRELILNEDLDIKSEFLLFLANRNEHIIKNIKPNIKKTIFTDRSYISGLSYGIDINEDENIYLNNFALDNIKLDKTIILILDKETLTKRLSLKKNDKIELRGIEYLLNIQKRMIYFCKKLNIDFITIDAKEKKEIITQKIVNFIDK